MTRNVVVRPKRGRPRAPKLPASERRQQIVVAARGLFARGGYASTSTSDIAVAAGIREPTIYRYFPSKQDLYLEVIGWNAQQIRATWERIAAEKENALAALVELGRHYADQLDREPAPLQLHFRALSEMHDKRVRDVVRSEYRKLMAIIELLFEKAQRQGSVRRDADVLTLTWSFLAFGALLDVTRLLGLEAELTTDRLAAMTGLLVDRRPDQALERRRQP